MRGFTQKPRILFSTYIYTMSRYLFLLVVSCLCLSANAQAQDTLYAQASGNDVPHIDITPEAGSTIMSVAKQFSVPPAFLADMNGMNVQQDVTGKKIKIPIGNYNYRRTDMSGNEPIYYRVKIGDKIATIARSFNATPESIKGFNPPRQGDVKAGEVLRVGYISYSAPPMKQRVVEATPVVDTAMPVLTPIELQIDSMQSSLEAQYLQQSGGISITEESGAAVLFESKAPAKPGMFYAFHNTAPRGTIMKVHNPAADKTIYVKVIGRIPELKEYNNAIIGISGKAAPSLGTSYKRTFCKVSY